MGQHRRAPALHLSAPRTCPFLEGCWETRLGGRGGLTLPTGCSSSWSSEAHGLSASLSQLDPETQRPEIVFIKTRIIMKTP